MRAKEILRAVPGHAYRPQWVNLICRAAHGRKILRSEDYRECGLILDALQDFGFIEEYGIDLTERHSVFGYRRTAKGDEELAK